MNMEFPKRKPTRLKKYDYSQNGYYFVTICTHNKKHIFGNIVGQGSIPSQCEGNVAKRQRETASVRGAPAEINLSECGKIAESEITNLENRYKHVKIDKYVIMPNHIHAIIIIDKYTAGASPCPTLSEVICSFKSITTRKCHNINPDQKIWQTSFHDHIIRGEDDYFEIWEYIDGNPAKWTEDCYYKN